MSVEDRQDIPYPVGDEPNNVSRILPFPVFSSSYSLEDGEIVEGHFSGSMIADPELPSPQPSDQPKSHLSDQGRTPIPAEPVDNIAFIPTVEPMTDEDLDRAKSLVLDLLGWGVTPEYFVECGLSPGAIYKIFTDLRLRLPRNLELSSPPATRSTPR